MVKLTFLGTAAAVSSDKRDNTALLLKTNKEIFLIDCPGSPVYKLTKAGFDFRKIDRIIFTHSHPDHIYGLPSLLHSQYKLNNKVEIYARRGVIKIIKSLVKVHKLEDRSKFPQIIYEEISAELNKPFYMSEDLSIYAFGVKHSPDSLGFKFLFENGKSLIYSGDTAYSEKILKASKDADYLIHDCFSPSRFFNIYEELKKEHTDSLSLGRLAKEANVKLLIPIHFCTELNFSFKEIIGEIKENFKGRIIIPEDFDSLKLD
jgi:ribonuclease Z